MYACVCGPEEYQTPALSDHLARVLEVLSHLSSPQTSSLGMCYWRAASVADAEGSLVFSLYPTL